MLRRAEQRNRPSIIVPAEGTRADRGVNDIPLRSVRVQYVAFYGQRGRFHDAAELSC
jgi:hypothetical protein